MCENICKKFKRFDADQRRLLIDKWIFVKKHREIMVLKIIDGLTYEAIAEQFEMSDRQIKNIVYKCTQDIFESMQYSIFSTEHR